MANIMDSNFNGIAHSSGAAYSPHGSSHNLSSTAHGSTHSLTTSSHNLATNIFAAEEDDEMLCPLCVEVIEIDDKYFLPCPCGYQVCSQVLIY